ncbi:MAG: DUF4296 domain-containing protein [Bacteroidales bacterium]|nr:DUF4296 domain-containing protein [Bacteroidales bacterium]
MRLILFILSWIILLNACSPGDKKNRKKDIIPREDMVHILEDVHLINGFFSMSYLRKIYPGTDSLSNYRDVIGKYGYSLDDFNNTIDYYADHLNDYEKIYEEVLKDLKSMQESSYKSEMHGRGMRMKPRGREENLWTMKTEWHLPREGTRNKIPFSVEVNGRGVYTLNLRIRIGKNDRSRHPFILAYFCRDDSTKEENRIYWKRQKLKKTGDEYKQYILSAELKDSLVTHLQGFLLDDENTDTLYIKHADIKDIKLDVKPFYTEVADTSSNQK